MTTIAYKDGVLAADTGMCVGGTMLGSLTKIVRRGDGDMAGAAGDAAYNWRFIQWFMAGEKGDAPEAVREEDSLDRGVIFRRLGDLVVFEPRGFFVVRAPFYALGSGKSEAVGAMMAGADAPRAVMIARELDPHTAGEITVLRHGD